MAFLRVETVKTAMGVSAVTRLMLGLSTSSSCHKRLACSSSSPAPPPPQPPKYAAHADQSCGLVRTLQWNGWRSAPNTVICFIKSRESGTFWCMLKLLFSVTPPVHQHGERGACGRKREDSKCSQLISWFWKDFFISCIN